MTTQMVIVALYAGWLLGLVCWIFVRKPGTVMRGRESMDLEGMANLVRKWIESAGQANGPLLPDGWFGGRFRESIFFLQYVEVRDESLVVQLCDDTSLIFDRPVQVYVSNNDLIFDGFDRAALRWRPYGYGPEVDYKELSYTQGRIVLAAPINRRIRV